MTIIAIALKRYELQHRELPPTLDGLTPAILKTIPLDYMNGQALHYQKIRMELFCSIPSAKTAWTMEAILRFINGGNFIGSRKLLIWFGRNGNPEEIQAYYVKQAKN